MSDLYDYNKNVIKMVSQFQKNFDIGRAPFEITQSPRVLALIEETEKIKRILVPTIPFIDNAIGFNAIKEASKIFANVPSSSLETSKALTNSLRTFARIANSTSVASISALDTANEISSFFENISSSLSGSGYEETFDNYRQEIKSDLDDICNSEQAPSAASAHCVINPRLKKILLSIIYTFLPVLLPMIQTQYLHYLDSVADQEAKIQHDAYHEKMIALDEERLQFDKEQAQLRQENFEQFLDIAQDFLSLFQQVLESLPESDLQDQDMQRPDSSVLAYPHSNPSQNQPVREGLKCAPPPELPSTSSAHSPAGGTNDADDLNTSK